MKSEIARRKVVEMLCRGMPKTHAYAAICMPKSTFNRVFVKFCRDAGLPTDTRLWYMNRESIMRNYEKYEQYLKDDAELFTKYRQSLEQTNVYRGRSRVDDFRPLNYKEEEEDDILT